MFLNIILQQQLKLKKYYGLCAPTLQALLCSPWAKAKAKKSEDKDILKCMLFLNEDY